MTFFSLTLYIQSPWTVSISLCQVSCCPWQWCSFSWFFDANSTVSTWVKLRDPENVCLININRVGQLSSGKSHFDTLCFVAHFLIFSPASWWFRILNPWIWLANRVLSSGADFPIQTQGTDRSKISNIGDLSSFLLHHKTMKNIHIKQTASLSFFALNAKWMHAQDLNWMSLKFVSKRYHRE